MPSPHLSDTIESEQSAEVHSSGFGQSIDRSNRGPGGKVRIIIIVCVVLGLSGLTSWKIYRNLNDPTTAVPAGRKGSSGGDRPVPVTTSVVQQKTMPIYLTGLGTVTAYYAVTIKTRVDGELMSVDVREGQKVKKGQLLAQIDPAPYAAAVAQAEGQLAKDKATANYATLEAERYKKLFDAGVVSQDSQQTQAAMAGQGEGTIQADKAAIQAARVSLAYTRITSPVEGVVGLRQVDPGNIVHAADSTGLLLLTQLQPISVIFTLPEDKLPLVERTLAYGRKLEVEAYDRSQKTKLATGKLLTLDNQIDTATGTDKAKAVFDNKDNSLFSNQFVNVRLILEERPDTLVIPSSAIQTGAKGNFVYVVKKGDPPLKSDDSKTGPDPMDASGNSGSGHKLKDKADSSPIATHPADDGEKGDKDSEKKYYVEVRPITIDATEGTQVIVSFGLAAGEQVVIDGLEKLKGGTRVLPKRDNPKGGKPLKGGGAAPDGGQSPSTDKDSAASGTGKHHHNGEGGSAKTDGSIRAAEGVGAAVDGGHGHHHNGQHP